MVKQRALSDVLTSKPARGDIQQLIQSRAELYGDSLDPKWFNQSVDLGSKTKTTNDRNKARALLAAASLLVAQLGAHILKKKLQQGDVEVVHSLRMGEQMSIAQLLARLSKAPPMAILQLSNP